MKKEYTIGLDIGTNSVGWSVLTDDYRLVSKKMKVAGNTEKSSTKKNFWGVRLFDEGQTAEARRSKRTARRRLARRRQRILELQKIFAPEILKIDEHFFARLNESFLVLDEKKQSRHPVFATIKQEKSYHQTYPTIYHLRQALADSSEKADIRLVYLAMAHLLKYRGNFLIEGELNTENSSVTETFRQFLSTYNQQFSEAGDKQTEKLDEAVDCSFVFTEKMSKTKKAETLLKYFPHEKSNGYLSQFIKLMVGNQGNFKNVFGLEEEAKLQFSKETYEEDLEELLEKIGDDYIDLFVQAKNVYDAVLLSEILSDSTKNTRAKLSAGMIRRYDAHKEDLVLLKRFVKENLPKKYRAFFGDNSVNGYAGYIEGHATQEDFYKFVKKELTGIRGSEVFLTKIEQENFLRKQRTFDNGVIPHQIHLTELRAIIANQKKHYPFLKEEQEKLESLLTFKIPYYVGPLAKKQENSPFAWLIRKSEEKIKPWNLPEIVDMEGSAVRFIERMINTDMYMPHNKVLPKNSLLYQKFSIYNELTKVRYQDERGQMNYFSSIEKKEIFHELFEKNRKVTKKDLQEFLYLKYDIKHAELSGIEKAFNASYTTYHDFLTMSENKREMEQWLEDPELASMFEEIIKTLTVFEDREMIKTRLSHHEATLGKHIIKKLTKKHYTGWGRLSKELIQGIRDKQSNKTILDYLINDDDFPHHRNRNFMQLINYDSLSFKKEIKKAQMITDTENLEEIVKELTGSPAIKKGILQSLKIVDEIVGIMGYEPANIVVEMARENQTTGRGLKSSRPRLKALEESLKDFGSQLLKEYPTDNSSLQKDRLYLYYLQNGRDMYTGAPLDIHRLSDYDIDHIIPRSFTTDNSIDNKVLVSSKENRLKKDDVPSEKVVKKMRSFWYDLYSSKLISKRKLDNLTKIKLTEEDKAGFIKRQLVETRQITKHVAGILHHRFNKAEDTNEPIRKVRIITLKSALVSQFRNRFGIYKVREINEYHHAHDAYLNGVIALALLKKYPQLAPEFVYGEYLKFNAHKANKATVKKEFYSNIMKFFESDTPVCDENGEIFWDKSKSIAQVKKVINHHHMNIVKKTEIQKGGFSKETVEPKKDSSKLLPRKNNWDPAKYGGLGSPNVAYTVAFTYEKGKARKRTNALEGITIMEREAFEQSPVLFLKNKGYEQAEIEMKLPKYALFELENGRKRMVASNKEAQKANSFLLPEHLVTLLYHAKQYDEISHKESFDYVNEHHKEFSEVFARVLEFAGKYTLAEKNIEKLEKIYKENQTDDLAKLASSFVNLMQFNAMGAPADFKFFDVTIPRKRYTSLTEIWQSTIIHQSITGLYETRIRMGK